MVIGKARARERDDAKADSKQTQEEEEPACRCARGGPGSAGDFSAGKTERGKVANAPLHNGVNRDEGQQTQEIRILKLEIAVHARFSVLVSSLTGLVSGVDGLFENMQLSLALRDLPSRRFAYGGETRLGLFDEV